MPVVTMLLKPEEMWVLGHKMSDEEERQADALYTSLSLQGQKRPYILCKRDALLQNCKKQKELKEWC
jgi:hypothetical protein